MMMRFSKVTPEGGYVPPPPANSKASYATMLYVRADIVRNAGGAPLASARWLRGRVLFPRAMHAWFGDVALRPRAPAPRTVQMGLEAWSLGGTQ